MIPASAICFYKDGDKWCAVHGDFVNLQESPAGFGDTFEDALSDLMSVNKECPHEMAGEQCRKTKEVFYPAT